MHHEPPHVLRLPLAQISPNSALTTPAPAHSRPQPHTCPTYSLRGRNDEEKAGRSGRIGKLEFESLADRLPQVAGLVGKRGGLREEGRPDRMELMLQEKLRIEMGDKNIEKNIKKVSQQLGKLYSKGSCIARIAAEGSFHLEPRPRPPSDPLPDPPCDENDPWASNSLCRSGVSPVRSCR